MSLALNFLGGLNSAGELAVVLVLVSAAWSKALRYTVGTGTIWQHGARNLQEIPFTEYISPIFYWNRFLDRAAFKLLNGTRKANINMHKLLVVLHEMCTVRLNWLPGGHPSIGHACPSSGRSFRNAVPKWSTLEHYLQIYSFLFFFL